MIEELKRVKEALDGADNIIWAYGTLKKLSKSKVDELRKAGSDAVAALVRVHEHIENLSNIVHQQKVQIEQLEFLRRKFQSEMEYKSKVDANALEYLASLEHEQWMQWAKTLMLEEAITIERKERWWSCMKPYAELTEEQKEHDRVWARKVLAILNRLIAQMEGK